MAGDAEKRVVLGRVSGLYGVKGWVKVFSETQPRENILSYSPWQLKIQGEWQTRTVETGRRQGKGVVAKLEGCDERDAAAALMGAEIAVSRDQLPPLESGEYYWADLVGLQVETLDGVPLGVVDHLFETGANDVVVVKGARERLIPFVRPEVVREIDLAAGRMRVDWDPEF
ncbi:MAG: ribosome maturation factor RimM [Gammaproteobacteria bacterium]|jgi:16S rRNA processing protein RimM